MYGEGCLIRSFPSNEGAGGASWAPPAGYRAEIRPETILVYIKADSERLIIAFIQILAT